MGGIIFGGSQGDPVGIGFSDGPLYFLNQNGVYRICSTFDGPFYFPVYGRKSLLIFDDSSISLLDLSTCHYIKKLVELSVEVPWSIKILSAMPSDSGNDVIFSEMFSTLPNITYKTFVINIDTGIITKVLEGGFNASLSPDERKIAFVGNNGIYVANVDGTQQTLLVPIKFNPYSNIYPWPFWSIDGTLLVYHKCNNDACGDISDFSIYQVNVKSGVEKKIIDGGLYPNWIKP